MISGVSGTRFFTDATIPGSDASVLRLAVESASTGILVCDEAGTILYANRQVGTIFGYAEHHLPGLNIDALIATDGSAGRPRAARFRHLDSQPLAWRDHAGRRRDGSPVAIDVSHTRVKHDDGFDLVVVSIMDVSDRIALQQRLVESARDHATFERLVLDLSARLVSVTTEQLDTVIVESLHQLCDALDLDRSTWWRFAPETGDAFATHTWTRPEYHVVQAGESALAQMPALLGQLRLGEVASFRSLEEADPRDREGLRQWGAKAGIAVPFLVSGKVTGLLGFSAMRGERDWRPELIDRLRLASAVIGQAITRKESEERLRAALSEVRQLRDDLALENVHLRREAKGRGTPRTLLAESSAVKAVVKQIESVAPTNATVLLLGETGSGKEVFAQEIHRLSERRHRPMIIVNCGAIPSTLIESELFGRERGAFTGALARQVGRFELASGSTIFLDEVGELPLESQVKLLRVLQERVIERLGGGPSVKVDVRIIAATNRDLEKAVEERSFREDLYYRLNVFPVTIPPLRERIEDIPALVWTFIDEFSTTLGKSFDSISKDSLAALQRYSWPGNVRELRNVIERAVIVATGRTLVVEPPRSASTGRRRAIRLEEVEADHIREVMQSVGWRVRGRGGAADLLGIKPNTLHSRMVKLGIRRPA